MLSFHRFWSNGVISGGSWWMDPSLPGSDWKDNSDYQRSEHRRQTAVPGASLQHGRTQCSGHFSSTRHHQRDYAWVFKGRVTLKKILQTVWPTADMMTVSCSVFTDQMSQNSRISHHLLLLEKPGTSLFCRGGLTQNFSCNHKVPLIMIKMLLPLSQSARKSGSQETSGRLSSKKSETLSTSWSHFRFFHLNFFTRL